MSSAKSLTSLLPAKPKQKTGPCFSIVRNGIVQEALEKKVVEECNKKLSAQKDAADDLVGPDISATLKEPAFATSCVLIAEGDNLLLWNDVNSLV